MVKPGLPYLDVISKLNHKFDIPIFAYQVSGEYSMIMNAINNGLLDRSVKSHFKCCTGAHAWCKDPERISSIILWQLIAFYNCFFI